MMSSSTCMVAICFYGKQQKADPRMGKTDSFLKSIGLLRLVFKMNINYCPKTHTSFDSFYKLTVVYKWQLDSSVTTQACVNIIENFLRTERKDL